MSGEKITVVCVHCKMPIGMMDISDLGIDCYEICNLCYSKFYKLIEFVESLTMRGLFSNEELEEYVKNNEGEWQSDSEHETALQARKTLKEVNDKQQYES